VLVGDFIYLSLGERGARDAAQDSSVYAGAVLRLNADGEFAPAAVTGGQLGIFTKGHRNPQGMAVNPQTGEIWLHEHGPKGGDEINILKEGANYGWPILSYGREYFGGKIGDGQTQAQGYVDPVWVWVPSIAPSGMAFYTGDMFPEFKGDLLVGSLKFRSLYHVRLEAGRPVSEQALLKRKIGRVRDLAEAADGSILLLSDEADGGLYRLSR
jgi:glucose/arabinose dehydrogenase